MNFISEISLKSKGESVQVQKELIQLQIYSEPCSPDLIVKNLSMIDGPIDIYCWYEGSQFLPKLGASFMKESLFKPLYKLKQDAKFFLYSLKAWDFKRNITTMPSSTRLGEAINRINKAAIECVYSSSFFHYCTKVQKGIGIYEYINSELPKKKWLLNLSESQRKKGMTIDKLFNEQASLFDCIKDLDVSAAYSSMQYIEGYFLIQESVRMGLLKGQKKIQIAFVLPNDESKYYLDYPKDIKNMLSADFGKDLLGVDVQITFHFFEYGDSINSRPYIDKRPIASKVNTEEIGSYFNYLFQPPSTMTIQRDVIHNINGWF